MLIIILCKVCNLFTKTQRWRNTTSYISLINDGIDGPWQNRKVERRGNLPFVSTSPFCNIWTYFSTQDFNGKKAMHLANKKNHTDL